MEAKEILLDTNVFRRVLENDNNMFSVLNAMKNDGYDFAVTDMSLFELLCSDEIQSNKIRFLTFLYDYKVMPICKKIIPDFPNQYMQWFTREFEIEELKKQIFPSFAFTLSSILAMLTNAIIIFIANKLANDYSSEFYKYILSVTNFENVKEHYNNVLKSSYLLNREKLRKRIPLELKDLILRELTYYNLLKSKEVFNESEFKNEFLKQQRVYKDKSFKDICSSILTESDIEILNTDKIEKLDAIFLMQYLKDILCHSKKFDINDLTDYINFKYAIKFYYAYYTIDNKSLKKYVRYFNDEHIQKYLDNINSLLKKYKYTK